ncbi:hypothetical protein [Mycobacterium uberis]|uniref:hypothetical protein n=1 Tax=Mycobacterium uberis TaxID=2162698 RepID=UPI001403690A|nr:hypothetical protein [Mycobacterium uberis]
MPRPGAVLLIGNKTVMLSALSPVVEDQEAPPYSPGGRRCQLSVGHNGGPPQRPVWSHRPRFTW